MCERGLPAILLDSSHLAHRLFDLRSDLPISGYGSVQRSIRIHNSLAHQVTLGSVSRMKRLDPLKLQVGEIKLPTEPHQISVAIRGH